MSHSIFDLITHTAAMGVAIATAIEIDFSDLPSIAENLAAKERSLVVCGSAASGLLNLADAVSTSAPVKRAEYKSALNSIQSRIDAWLARQSIPTPDGACTVELNGKQFQARSYRLDEIDAPERRVNWSFQINYNEEI